jgi:shikimate dehydrogenase
VAHSLSPVFQNAALRHAGIDLTYTAIDVLPQDLERTMIDLRAANGAGNVTIPHKAAMLELCDQLSPLAREIGAVNTFWTSNGVLFGDNTDASGFDAAVRAFLGAPPHDLRVTVLGAGGAAAAVVAAVRRWKGSVLTVWNRTPDRAYAFAQRYDDVRVKMDMAHAVNDADLVVNATAIGLHDDCMPIDIELLPPHAAVFDIVYSPDETAWVRTARNAGHLAADGLGMLVEQGALAFERWFGIAPDRRVMWRSLVNTPLQAR